MLNPLFPLCGSLEPTVALIRRSPESTVVPLLCLSVCVFLILAAHEMSAIAQPTSALLFCKGIDALGLWKCDLPFERA